MFRDEDLNAAAGLDFDAGRDAESGLDYLTARYYAPNLGRFSTADLPLVDHIAYEPQSWSLYNYVRNNPLRFFDPTGRKCVKTDDGQVADDGQGEPCQDVVEADTDKATVFAYPQLPQLVALALRSSGDTANRHTRIIANEIGTEARDAVLLAALPPIAVANYARRIKWITKVWTSTKHLSRYQNTLRHFRDHGSDFPGIKTVTEYVKKAHSFANNPPMGTFTTVRSNGDVVLYHPFSNTFAVRTKDEFLERFSSRTRPNILTLRTGTIFSLNDRLPLRLSSLRIIAGRSPVGARWQDTFIRVLSLLRC